MATKIRQLSVAADPTGPEDALSKRINLPEIRRIAAWAAEGVENLERLWRLAGSDNRQTGVNALWVMTHLPRSESAWLDSHQGELIDMLLIESDVARKRMLLQLLKGRKYHPDTMRTDFLDYCLLKINSECEAYSVRAFCIHVAFKMCRHYPELLAELEEHLSMLALQHLPPGLTSARRNVLAAMKKIEYRPR